MISFKPLYSIMILRRQLSLRSIILLFTFFSSLITHGQSLHLFTPEMRQAVGRQTIIMDFVERYFSDYFKKNKELREIQLADDRVFFRQGRPEDLLQLTDTIPFSITYHAADDMFTRNCYEISWFLKEKPIVCIVFPAQYELILGHPLNEMQLTIQQGIASAPPREIAPIDAVSLQSVSDNKFVHKTEHYQLQSLTDATYYEKVNGKPKAIFDTTDIEASAANLLLGCIEGEDRRFYVEQALYDMKSTSFTTSLSHWLDFCAAQNMMLFFAVEEVHEDGLKALVIARNSELGYNHLLSVILPDDFIVNSNAVLKARLNAYIPTHNVKDMFAKPAANHKKQHWQ